MFRLWVEETSVSSFFCSMAIVVIRVILYERERVFSTCMEEAADIISPISRKESHDVRGATDVPENE